MATAETAAAPKGRSGAKRTLGIAAAVVLALLIAWAVVAFLIFRARAEGIAVGYLEAAVTAYQMERYGRPIPDRIFETHSYLVDTKAHGNPPSFEVVVKGYYTRFPYFSMTRTAEVAGHSPAPSLEPPPR